MTTETKQINKEEITKISKQFAEAFKGTFGGINGTGWLIVDPLSAYLNAMGFENKLHQLPANEKHPQILVMTFTDGSQFIPAGGDLKSVHKDAKKLVMAVKLYFYSTKACYFVILFYR